MKSLRNWRDREGLDITDVDAVLHRAGKHPSTAGGESWSEARRRRAVADADRAEILAKREAGAVVAVADVHEVFSALGSEMKARLLAMRATLVEDLTGRPPEAIARILDDRIRELLASIFDNSRLPSP